MITAIIVLFILGFIAATVWFLAVSIAALSDGDIDGDRIHPEYDNTYSMPFAFFYDLAYKQALSDTKKAKLEKNKARFKIDE